MGKIVKDHSYQNDWIQNGNFICVNFGPSYFHSPSIHGWSAFNSFAYFNQIEVYYNVPMGYHFNELELMSTKRTMEPPENEQICYHEAEVDSNMICGSPLTAEGVRIECWLCGRIYTLMHIIWNFIMNSSSFLWIQTYFNIFGNYITELWVSKLT